MGKPSEEEGPRLSRFRRSNLSGGKVAVEFSKMVHTNICTYKTSLSSSY
jgi:hypothetical protein